jgi:thiol-disulfide isomerase/thioredoxin
MNPITIAAACSLLAGLTMPVTASAQRLIGQEAPALLGYDRAGDKVLLNDLRGKVVVATFWASWCGPCQQELPVLEKIQNAVGPQRLRVVAVNIEDRDMFRRASRTLADWKLLLAHDPIKEARTAYQVSGIPHLFIISKQGTILKSFQGYTEEKIPVIAQAVMDAVNE